MKNQENRFIHVLPLFAFIILSIVKATAQTLLAEPVNTPWYTAWWMWAGLILFVIILAGVGNTGRKF
jgi:hypothetical protein